MRPPSAGSRRRARSRSSRCRRAGRPCRGGSGCRRRRRSSGSRTPCPRRLRAADPGSVPSGAAHESSSSANSFAESSSSRSPRHARGRGSSRSPPTSSDRRPLYRPGAAPAPAAGPAARRTRTASPGSRRRRVEPGDPVPTASRAVSISTGVQMPAGGRSRQVEAVDAGEHHVEHDGVVRRAPPSRSRPRRARRCRRRAPPHAAAGNQLGELGWSSTMSRRTDKFSSL